MDLLSLAIGKASGGGGDTPTGTINISSNGEHNVAEYAKANVSVPNPSTGTKQIPITQNGTTTENVTDYASAEISVSVPNTYAAGDEGKVVSNGALVAQTSDTVTTNDTYDTTLINSLTVNVSGSGMTLEELYSQQKPTGNVEYSLSSMKANPLDGNGNITKITAPNLTEIATSLFRSMSGLEYVIAPKCTKVNGSCIYGDSNLLGIDIKGGTTNNDVGAFAFGNNSKLTTLIIRQTSGIMPASQNNILNNSKSSSKPVHVYVPNSLKSNYETATNWSTWKTEGTVVFHAIEGSTYETKYVDGTTIPS